MNKILILFLLVTGLVTSCHVHKESSVAGTNFYQPGLPGITETDSLTTEFISPYKKKLNAELDFILVYSISSLEKGKPESKLGNMVADACLAISNEKYNPADGNAIDFCVLNNGGLRSSLPAGAITKKNIFELMPFENELVVLTLTGKAVNKILEYISASGGVPVSGLRMKLAAGKFSDVTIKNHSFDSLATYKVLTSDYLAKGGDAMKMFDEKIALEKVNIKVRDAIMHYLAAINSRNEKLNPQTDGRISE